MEHSVAITRMSGTLLPSVAATRLSGTLLHGVAATRLSGTLLHGVTATHLSGMLVHSVTMTGLTPCTRCSPNQRSELQYCIACGYIARGSLRVTQTTATFSYRECQYAYTP